MTTPPTLTSDRRPDGTALLTVAGEIDMSNVDVFADAVESVDGPVVVDLTAVQYLDSAALAVLFAHVDRIEVIASSLLLPVLTISGLTALTSVHESDPAD